MSNQERQTTRQGTSLSSGPVKLGGNAGTADLLIARRPSESQMFSSQLMEEICERENMRSALRRVVGNAGAPGIDGLSSEELPEYLQNHWLEVKVQLLSGRYDPQPVRRVEIPKPSGGIRVLGIPCVLDRFIQQAVLQVLQKKWDERFSSSSYGFRPGRSAHDAVAQAQRYLESGYEYVVDIDLEKFFDRVNHDRLMSRLSQQIGDKRVLKLIRSYLESGVMEHGVLKATESGTPQGGPLSPFLSNVVLDELDKELERRGHVFVRYADDCNIYVRSQRAGERVMKSISRFITQRLKLRVNRQKSGVARAQERTFLGFSFTGGRRPNRRQVSGGSIKRLKSRIRRLTRRNDSMRFESRIRTLSSYIRGWKGYYGFAEATAVLAKLDSWIRHRLRSVLWKQWKTYRRRKSELIQRGVEASLATHTAKSTKGPWRISHSPGVHMALPNTFFDSLGLPRLI